MALLVHPDSSSSSGAGRRREAREVTGLWGGERASRVALQIGRDMFLANYPELGEIGAPVRPLRKSRNDLALSPVSDLIHSVLGGSSAGSRSSPPHLPTRDRDRDHGGGRRPPETTTPIERVARRNTRESFWRYASIVPSDLTFRLYVDLLGSEDESAEIPVVLAWMRYLNVRPSRATLATALVYWAEVGMDAPLVEMIKVKGLGFGGEGGRRRGSPYEELWAWMEGWLSLIHI